MACRRRELADGLHLSIAYSISVAHGDIYVAGFACQDSAPNCAVAQLLEERSSGAVGQREHGWSQFKFQYPGPTFMFSAGNQSDEFAEASEEYRVCATDWKLGEVAAANQVVHIGGDVYIGGAIENDTSKKAVASLFGKMAFPRNDYRRYPRRFGLRSHRGQTVAMLERTMVIIHRRANRRAK